MIIIDYKNKKNRDKIALFLYRHYCKREYVLIEEIENQIHGYCGYHEQEVIDLLNKYKIKFKKDTV